MRMQDFFTYYIRQQTILADITVGCQSNGPTASSIAALLAPAAQSSAGETACSCLQWPVVLSLRPHRPLLLPPLARPCGDGSLTRQPNQSTLVLSTAWAATVVSSPAPCRSLRRPCRCPLPWCSRRGVVNVVNERHPSEVDCVWRG